MLQRLEPERAARLLLMAARMAKPRVLGDLPGHEFHGNQYTDAEAASYGASLKTSVNFYKGTFFGGKSQMEEIAVKLPSALVVKGSSRGPQYHVIKDASGRVFGPSGWVGIKTLASELPIHIVADAHTAKLSVTLRYAFAAARKAARKQDSAAKATSVAIVTLRQELKDLLPKVLRRMYAAGGEIGASKVTLRHAEEFRAAKREAKPEVGFTFNAKTQAAIDWADRHAAELIDQISETSREAINNAVAEFLETGDWKDYRDEILAAVGDADRADLIARNESMVAVHEGQREAWGQAVEAGLLDDDSEREWIVVGDEKVCPICEGLEGKRAKMGESYVSDGEEYEGPPAHVSCRCSEGIVS